VQSQHQNVSDMWYICWVVASHARHSAGLHWMKDADFDTKSSSMVSLLYRAEEVWVR